MKRNANALNRNVLPSSELKDSPLCYRLVFDWLCFAFIGLHSSLPTFFSSGEWWNWILLEDLSKTWHSKWATIVFFFSRKHKVLQMSCISLITTAGEGLRWYKRPGHQALAALVVENLTTGETFAVPGASRRKGRQTDFFGTQTLLTLLRAKALNFCWLQKRVLQTQARVFFCWVWRPGKWMTRH